VKNQQTTIITEEKFDTISWLEWGEHIVDLWYNVRFTHVSVCIFLDNAERINQRPGTQVFE
jgi:hypothetical protein